MDKSTILSRITEQQIYQHYLMVDAEPNKYYQNIVAGGNSKTLKFFTNKDGELLFKDFSPQRENFKGDIIQAVLLTRPNVSGYKEAINTIMTDFKLGFNTLKDIVPIQKRNIFYEAKKPSDIKVITQPFTGYDYNYWGQYFIDLSLLPKYHVYSLKASFLNNNLWLTSIPHRPLFGYKHGDLWKVYCPLRKDMKKWCGNWNKNCIGGLDNIDYNCNYLIITSSIKDGLILSTHGYNQISLPSENTIPTILEEVISKFQVVFAFLDFDEAGHKWNEVIQNSFNNVIAVNYKDELVKDISDYSKTYGYTKTKELLSNLFKFQNDVLSIEGET